MKAILISLSALTLLVSGGALAASQQAHLVKVGIDRDVDLGLLMKSGSWSSSHGSTGCTDTSSLGLQLTSESGLSMYSTALAALLAGHQVKVWTAGCYEGLPRVVRLDIVP